MEGDAVEQFDCQAFAVDFRYLADVLAHRLRSIWRVDAFLTAVNEVIGEASIERFLEIWGEARHRRAV